VPKNLKNIFILPISIAQNFVNTMRIVLMLLMLVPWAFAFETQLVMVNDVDNPPDTTGYGAVSYEFLLGKYETSIGEYTEFLNSIAKSDPYQVYNPSMAQVLLSAGILRTGDSGSYSYRAFGPAGTNPEEFVSTSGRPISFVSWFQAARFINWLSNGQPQGPQDATSTEDGSYTLNGTVTGTAVPLNAINPNTGFPPQYTIPTEDEWYKAAYYAGDGAYWTYPTQSNNPPSNTLGSNSTNMANFIIQPSNIYCVTQSSSLDTTNNYLTKGGAFTNVPGRYGTFDMAGNVWELTDGGREASASRPFRGGAFTSYVSYIQSTYRQGGSTSNAAVNSGFRYSSRLPDPTPPSDGNAVTYDMVPVGDAGNNADPATLFGGVDYEYSVGKYAVTIGQYASFLNAVAAMSDSYGLYRPEMESDINTAGIRRLENASSGKYVYEVMLTSNGTTSANMPIAYVDWFQAARFANWMSNGQLSGYQTSQTTENGAYALNGAVSGIAVPANAVNPNSKDNDDAPMYRIATEDEWYKAAYYSTNYNSAGEPGYYNYCTQSDALPGNVVGSDPNQANIILNGLISATQNATLSAEQTYLTDGDAYSNSPSYYGTYDMCGNLFEWNDLDGEASVSRGIRGSFWFAGASPMEKGTYASLSTTDVGNDKGFRLVTSESVGPSPVPPAPAPTGGSTSSSSCSSFYVLWMSFVLSSSVCVLSLLM